jgi:hypothetical protein
MFSTFISIWIYNNFSNNTVNFLSIVFQIVGENLSGMLAINSDYDSDSTNE